MRIIRLYPWQKGAMLSILLDFFILWFLLHYDFLVNVYLFEGMIISVQFVSSLYVGRKSQTNPTLYGTLIGFGNAGAILLITILTGVQMNFEMNSYLLLSGMLMGVMGGYFGSKFTNSALNKNKIALMPEYKD